MIIWKPLIGDRLQYVKEPTNEMDKNAAAVARTNSHSKKEVVGYVPRSISMIASISLFLPHCVLDIFAVGKHVNHGGAYGLEMPDNFHFYEPEKAIKLAKK